MARAPLPMATTPAARPSRPSMKLMALVRAMTHAAVIRGMMPGVSTTNPARGNLNSYMVTPMKYKMLAARTWPAILAGADMSRTSSISPTPKMATPASTTPRGSEEPPKRWCMEGMGGAAHQDAHAEADQHGRSPAVRGGTGVDLALVGERHVGDATRQPGGG